MGTTELAREAPGSPSLGLALSSLLETLLTSLTLEILRTVWPGVQACFPVLPDHWSDLE